ncbi:PliI family lysozyme inhibitor of I-type lysozyme [Motiliproteus sp.]|uniref:PliI family lysozyme inhibitor of I-type lysozyme n=1 Tax=Motiliproteus sp. TaxID=1898955 RepID=UPI003BAC6FFB
MFGAVLVSTAQAEAPQTFVKQLTLGDGRVVVISEGPGEPRSLGSFSVRLYSGASPQFPLDDFVGGQIYPRDGTIESVRLVDELPYLLQVEIRSAGSGGYRNDWQCGFVDNRVFCQPLPSAAVETD